MGFENSTVMGMSSPSVKTTTSDATGAWPCVVLTFCSELHPLAAPIYRFTVTATVATLLGVPSKKVRTRKKTESTTRMELQRDPAKQRRYALCCVI